MNNAQFSHSEIMNARLANMNRAAINNRTGAAIIDSLSSFRSTQQTTIARFGKSRSSRILSSRTPLTDEQVRNVAPSIFATEKHASRSERFSYIPTSEVLAGLRKEGFHPFHVQQGGSRDQEKTNFTKHMLRLRHESAMEATVGQTFREIVLVNAHDGTSSYKLMAGIFRLVCGNGMIVGEGNIDEIRIKHSGDVVPLVIDGCVEILSRLPEVSAQVQEWNGLSLTAPEQAAFARAALELRYDDEEKQAPIRADQLLTVKRREDAAPTLWNTLNVVQENSIRGGLAYVLRDENGQRKQSRRTGEVRGIDANVKLNKALWTLAEEMRKLKTA